MPICRGIGLDHFEYEHEPWLTPLFKRLLSSRSGAFVDVGVNIGQTLIKVINCDPTRVYFGFEPSPHCYIYVTRIKQLNKLEHVRLVAVGLSNRSHLGQLFGKNLTDTNATTVKGFRGSETDGASQLVPLFRGDDILPNTLDVAVIKIDVEGGELEVLQGLHETIRRCRPFILCEVLPIYEESTEVGKMRRERTNELLKTLRSLDYAVARLMRDETIVVLRTIETHANLKLCEYLFFPSEVALGKCV